MILQLNSELKQNPYWVVGGGRGREQVGPLNKYLEVRKPLNKQEIPSISPSLPLYLPQDHLAQMVIS